MPGTLMYVSTSAPPGALAEQAGASPACLVTEPSKLVKQPPSESSHHVRPGTAVLMDWEALGKMQRKTSQ